MKMDAKTDIRVLKKQLTLMRKKLKEEGAKMPAERLVVEFDNGGGQTGLRENPYFPAYEKLLASYTKGLAVLEELMESQPAPEANNLELIRAKFKVG